MTMSKASLSTRIDSAVKEDLEEVCEWSDRSQSYHNERALKDYLAKMKAFKALIEEADDDIREARTVPHEQVMAWLKSWGTKNELPTPKPTR